MSGAQFEEAVLEAQRASRELDTASIFKRLDPVSYHLAVRKAGLAFERLIDAVLVERERIYGEAPTYNETGNLS